jgi:hypothetical protein
MYTFFVRVFAAGSSPTSAAPLAISFEAAVERLSQLPGMFVEGDGAFVWRSAPHATSSWQVDGTLYDRGTSLFYVEMKGHCPEESFNDFLAALHTADQTWAFEWVSRGLLMTEAAFRLSAANPAFHATPSGD